MPTFVEAFQAHKAAAHEASDWRRRYLAIVGKPGTYGPLPEPHFEAARGHYEHASASAEKARRTDAAVYATRLTSLPPRLRDAVTALVTHCTSDLLEAHGLSDADVFDAPMSYTRWREAAEEAMVEGMLRALAGDDVEAPSLTAADERDLVDDARTQDRLAVERGK